MMKALFPISLNNQLFSTENVIEAYNTISIKYNSITFLVADQLQLYNKAIRISNNYTLSDVLQDFRKKTNYFEERKIWLEKLKTKINVDIPINWNIISVDDIINDHMTFTIYRNILIAFYTDSEFANDIKHTANLYALNKSSDYNFDKAQNLSIGYLLEEIALSIKLKVLDQIYDEFYIGNYAFPILKLFNEEYSFNAFSISGVSKPINFSSFKFHTFDIDKKRWT